MTLSEALSEGLMVTATGLIIVFAVLIILMITMMIMKKVFYKEDKPKTEEAPKTPEVQAAPPAPVQTAPADDGQLIAVLAAAVAASLNTSTYNLKIRSFRRIGNNAPDWNKAGLRDTIDSRF